MLEYLYRKRFGSKTAIFEPKLFPYKYLNILKPSHSSYLPAYKDGTDGVFLMLGYLYRKRFGSKIAIFKPNLFPYKYLNILKPSHSSYLTTYEAGTDRVF